MSGFNNDIFHIDDDFVADSHCDDVVAADGQRRQREGAVIANDCRVDRFIEVFSGKVTRFEGIDDHARYDKRIESLAGDLPVVFFVKNSSLFKGELLESDEEEKG